MSFPSKIIKHFQPREIAALNTFQCEYFNENTYKTTFLSFCHPLNNPDRIGIIFSPKSILDINQVEIIPVLPFLKFNVQYPIVSIEYLKRPHYFKFPSSNLIETFFDLINKFFFRIHEKKIHPSEILNSFFVPNYSFDVVNKFTTSSDNSLFNSRLRVSATHLITEPTVIALMMKNQNNFREYHTLRLYVVTWNIDQHLPNNDNEIQSLIDHFPEKQDKQPHDLIVVNFQEIDMSAECIMRGNSPEKKQKWI